MGQIVKLQHYVPRFYLEKFVDQSGQLHAYDKIFLSSFPLNPKAAASERYFYDLLPGRVQTVETQINQFYEDEFSSFYPHFMERVEKHHFFKLSYKDKEVIANFLAYQYLRTKRFREESYRLGTGINLYEPFQIGLSPLVAHTMLIAGHPLQKFVKENLLKNFYWVVFKNTSSLPLCTSDHPFAQKQSLDQIQARFNGDKRFQNMATLSDEIHFPLSPKYSLCLVQKGFATSWFKRVRNRKIDIGEIEVKQINFFQIKSCYRFIYLSEDDYSHVEEIERILRHKLIKNGRDPSTIRTPKPKNIHGRKTNKGRR
ncbi:DUF4238 domain-containing protein [Terribacillus halophilus]|uniref:DUF4238 domain-containing protein n=1 Tax=Terribacillus halophilus TaxID=361279 RepID=UPI00098452C1|nr:DUF4238 domain-containing protein [Terribacillus halophilus]